MIKSKISAIDLLEKKLTNDQIKKEYEEFIHQENLERNPNSAMVFAMLKIQNSFTYLGRSERQIILLLEGSLPHMYD